MVATGLVSAGALGGRVESSQTVTLMQGWNAFYLEVSPEQSAEELFSSWPVRSVSAYDTSAFLETRQYSGTLSSEGTYAPGYRVWRRGADEGLSTLSGVPANTVYMAYNTNATAFVTTIFGRPSAPRVSWHVSSTNETMNLVGVSTAGNTTIGDYFNGPLGGNASFYAYKVWGTNELEPKLTTLFPTSTLTNGDVVVATASKVSDWSGVLHVSPMSGIDFSTNRTLAAVSVRNDSTLPRTVRIKMGTGAAQQLEDIPSVPTGLLIRDRSVSKDWTPFTSSTPYERTLATNETLVLDLALDRTQLLGAAGQYYGALLTVSDATADGSSFRAAIPLEATSDGGAGAETAWPKGVWIASAELDEVTFFGPSQTVTNELESVVEAKDENGRSYLVTNRYESVMKKSSNDVLPAGGRMRIRLPLYVDGDGSMKLLQRFWYGSDPDHGYRVSTPFLPIDKPEIEAASGTFGESATFPFVVEETSKVNPMRHAFHPMHDGLRSDFQTPAPSGDDFRNYVSVVKPELFSITNTVVLTWDEKKGAAWSPEERLSGRIQWAFDGIRHEGTIQARGRFTMKRVTKGLVESRE